MTDFEKALAHPYKLEVIKHFNLLQFDTHLLWIIDDLASAKYEQTDTQF